MIRNIILTWLSITVFVSGNTFGGYIPTIHENGRSLEHRIVGGEEATPHEFPYIVGLRAFDFHLCEYFEIVAGDHNNIIEEGTEQKRSGVRSVLHPNYNPSNYSSDFALIQVHPPFEFNKYVQAAKLPPLDFIPTGSSTVAGWGALQESGNSPDTLYKVTVPLVDNARCNELYEETEYSIDETMICAGIAGKDSCQGDSGGPMVCKSGSEVVHCGVVSWGIGCARDGFPGVYARTSYFLDFIEEITGEKF